MAANARVDRAVVHTGATAYALQRCAQLLVGIGLRAAVVKQDQMHFFGTVEFAGLARTADQVEVGGDGLTRGRARQQAVERRYLLESFHHLLDAGDGDVDARHGGAHAAVAFVLNQAQRAGFGHHEIHAGKADIGVGKLASQDTSADLDQGVDIFGVADTRHLSGKEFSDFLFGLVNRRHDDVGGLLTCELHDVLTHIGLERFDARRFHGVVELDLFAHHGLALDDVASLDALRDLQGNGVGLLGCLGPVHLYAVGE